MISALRANLPLIGISAALLITLITGIIWSNEELQGILIGILFTVGIFSDAKSRDLPGWVYSITVIEGKVVSGKRSRSPQQSISFLRVFLWVACLPMMTATPLLAMHPLTVTCGTMIITYEICRYRYYRSTPFPVPT